MSDEGDDWFERALRDLDADGDVDDSEADDSEADGGSDEPAEHNGRGAIEREREDRNEGPTPDLDAETETSPSDGGFEDIAGSSADEGPHRSQTADDDPLSRSFGGGGDGFTAGEEPDVGPGVGTDAGEFARDEAFGFAAFEEDAPGGPPDFDEAEFDSDLERIELGIEGLDEMILGGVPRRSLIAAIGAAGTGKTTFALQFLRESLRAGERGVYITLEEGREEILSTAEEKGWPFREYESEGSLAVVEIDPLDMVNSLESIGNELSRLISEFGAERLVLDSVSLLEMMYDHPAKRRSEVFDFTRSLKDAGVTTMLTSEASADSPYASRYGIVEYLTDAVFILKYVRPSDFRATRLAVEIQKIRDANHSRETKPYEITDEGISVYQQANIF